MALMEYLAERRATIEAQIKALKAELAEIGIAEAALIGTADGKPAPAVMGHMIIKVGSIKHKIMNALMAFPDGLETDAVIEAIRKMGGGIVLRSSITPQLSRLKAANMIEYNGRHWRVPAKAGAPNDETPDVSPSGASVQRVNDELEDLLG